jgi:hypothetical protein
MILRISRAARNPQITDFSEAKISLDIFKLPKTCLGNCWAPPRTEGNCLGNFWGNFLGNFGGNFWGNFPGKGSPGNLLGNFLGNFPSKGSPGNFWGNFPGNLLGNF